MLFPANILDNTEKIKIKAARKTIITVQQTQANTKLNIQPLHQQNTNH